MKSKFLQIVFASLVVLTILGLIVALSSEEGMQDPLLTQNYQEDLELLSEIILPLESESDLNEIVNETKERKFVLLGESSHGTSEYYKWRAEISKRLIEENGFSFIAIEGDWPNIYEVNKYVKLMDDSLATGTDTLATIERWPPWMWNNEEFLELVEWVREYNEELPSGQRIGIYGMDMQDLNSAIEKSKQMLARINPGLKERISQELSCMENYNGDIQEYAQAYFSEDISCEDDVKNIIDEFNNTYSQNDVLNSEEVFKTYQNLLAIQYAEAYARELASQGSQSWNTRVGYMKETVENLSEKYQGSGMIWAHNTHLGDASATEMKDVGMVNIGQLLREEYDNENIFIVGFGTNTGKVMASFQWGLDPQILDLPPAIATSIESFLNRIDSNSFIIPMYKENIPEILTKRVGHRAKGVVYNPSNDHNHYVETILSQRYDAFIFIKETSALNPL